MRSQERKGGGFCAGGTSWSARAHAQALGHSLAALPRQARRALRAFSRFRASSSARTRPACEHARRKPNSESSRTPLIANKHPRQAAAPGPRCARLCLAENRSDDMTAVVHAYAGERPCRARYLADHRCRIDHSIRGETASRTTNPISFSGQRFEPRHKRERKKTHNHSNSPNLTTKSEGSSAS